MHLHTDVSLASSADSPKPSRDQRERNVLAGSSSRSRRVTRLLLLLFPALLSSGTVSPSGPAAPPAGFAVLSDDPGPWPQILSSVGFHPQSASAADIVVLRPGSPAASELAARVEQGAFVIVEGASTAADLFGFRAGKDHVVVGSVEDVHRPKLPIIWQKAVELPRFEIPKQARVFAKERWTSAPLIAGYSSGRGAVLWVAANPGDRAMNASPIFCRPSTISA